MKLTIIFIFAACLVANAEGYSQRVTLSVKNAPIEKVLTEIRKQTGYSFAYYKEGLRKVKNVTVNVNNASLTEVLNLVFKDQPLTYTITDNIIVIKAVGESKKNEEVITNELRDLLLITVKGRVVNESGEGVIVSVLVRGTNNGVTTNSDGLFVLNNVEENATLLITGVSVVMREIKVEGKTDLGNISTITKVSESEAVVINAGYYKVRKEDQTGSISRIDAKTIEKQPVTNPLQVLQGRAAGVYISQNSGIHFS